MADNFFCGVDGFGIVDLIRTLEDLKNMVDNIGGAAAALENALQFAAMRSDRDLTKPCAASAQLITEKADAAAAVIESVCSIMIAAEKAAESTTEKKDYDKK